MSGNVRQDLLASLKSVLSYHQQLGLEGYRNTDDLRTFLNYQPTPLGNAAVTGPAAAAPSTHRGGANTAVRPQQQKDAPPPLSRRQLNESLEGIADEIGQCRSCALHNKRLRPVPGRSGMAKDMSAGAANTATARGRVRLLVVGDWPSAGPDGQLPEGQLFGHEEDLMLARMFAAIRLSPDAVFVTNVIKCGLPKGSQPGALHVQSCMGYLQRQIRLLQPEVICTMGLVAVKAILNKKIALSRLRGSFHEYRLDDQFSVPVLPTYHPTFLLQNPEMKKATWVDLQLLARKMGLEPVR